MAKPKPKALFPEQLAEAVRIYTATGNVRRAAEAVGRTPSAMSKRLRAAGVIGPKSLYTQAIAEGLTEGRKQLGAALDSLARRLVQADSLEIRDLTALSGAVARVVDSLAGLQEREDRRRTMQVTRRKVIAEIRALERGESGSGDVEVTVQIAGGAPVGTDDAAE